MIFIGGNLKVMREWWMVVRRGRRGKRGELPVTGAGDGVLLVPATAPKTALTRW